MPYLVFSATACNFTRIAALDYAGSGNSRIGTFALRRATDTTGNTQEVFAVFTPSATGAVREPGSIALLGIDTLGTFGATPGRRRAA